MPIEREREKEKEKERGRARERERERARVLFLVLDFGSVQRTTSIVRLVTSPSHKQFEVRFLK